MNKEKLDLIRKTIKELHEKDILILDIDIIYELDSQLFGKTICDDDYIKLYNEIEHAYLKVENVDIGTIVNCALDNFEKIINEDEDFDLREESCWY